jgi:hypothetical protein
MWRLVFRGIRFRLRLRQQLKVGEARQIRRPRAATAARAALVRANTAAKGHTQLAVLTGSTTRGTTRRRAWASSSWMNSLRIGALRLAKEDKPFMSGLPPIRITMDMGSRAVENNRPSHGMSWAYSHTYKLTHTHTLNL